MYIIYESYSKVRFEIFARTIIEFCVEENQQT